MRDLADALVRKLNARTRVGSMFECDVAYAMKKKFPKFNNCIGTDLDKYEGTDFTHNGVRMDATLDAREKSYMPFVFESDIPATKSQRFKIGIRIANNHNHYNEFPEPVVVIGLDMDSHTYRLYQDEILENMIKHADDIMDAVNDAYLDYITDDKEERFDLFSQPLKINELYRENKNISEKYRALNNIQYKEKELENFSL